MSKSIKISKAEQHVDKMKVKLSTLKKAKASEPAIKFAEDWLNEEVRYLEKLKESWVGA